jgi:hypothetical protein
MSTISQRVGSKARAGLAEGIREVPALDWIYSKLQSER